MPLPFVLGSAALNATAYFAKNKDELIINRRRNLKKWFEYHEIPASDKSFISQLINGKASFGENAARNLEKKFSMPELFLDLNENAFKSDEDPKQIKAEGAKNDSVVMTLLDNHLAAGNGVINLDYPDTIRSIEFSPDKFVEVFQRKTANNLSMAIIDGNSMYDPNNEEMSLKHGDIVFIDTSIKEFRNDGIYAFVLEGQARIKRLQYMSGYRLKVISDNPTYETEILEKDQVEQIHFIGQLIKKMPMEMFDL